jgi:3-oxoacyl-[acyl-carrier-protein] synthase-3
MANEQRRAAHVTGWGRYAPTRVVTNDELSRMVDTSDEWIYQRTGILERRVASDDETTASMSLRAARDALDVAGLDPRAVELIIVGTVTPDHVFPSTACLVQDALGAGGAGAFDLAAGCSGFVYGLNVAAGLIESGMYENALVIGAETLSRITDWTDRDTCVLFGDGAGALVLQANGAVGGVLASVLRSDGSGGELLKLPAGGSALPASIETVNEREHYIHMNGRKVFRFASRVLAEATRQVVDMAGRSLEDVALFVPHQANGRIIQSAVQALKIPPDRVFNNLESYGNTSSASVPMALAEAIDEGRVGNGDLVVCVAFGAGLTWAATAFEWSLPLPVPKPARWRIYWRGLPYRLARIQSWWRRLWREADAWLQRLRRGEDD